jgi:F-box-like
LNPHFTTGPIQIDHFHLAFLVVGGQGDHNGIHRWLSAKKFGPDRPEGVFRPGGEIVLVIPKIMAAITQIVPSQRRAHQLYVISVLELEVSSTQRLLPRYLRAAAQKARGRPKVTMETLPHDILSIIFQTCAGLDWASPLEIAEVCRKWRTTVLATPRAWQFVNLDSNLPTKGVKIYFERSGQCPLHLCLPHHRSPTL